MATLRALYLRLSITKPEPQKQQRQTVNSLTFEVSGRIFLCVYCTCIQYNLSFSLIPLWIKPLNGQSVLSHCAITCCRMIRIGLSWDNMRNYGTHAVKRYQLGGVDSWYTACTLLGDDVFDDSQMVGSWDGLWHWRMPAVPFWYHDWILCPNFDHPCLCFGASRVWHCRA